MAASGRSTGIDLCWLPLGAGDHSVRWNGRVFESVAALLERRSRCDLYHSALQVRVPEAWRRDELGVGEMWNSNSLNLVADRA